jgi:hypothetical protein
VLVPSEHHISEFHAWVRARLGESPGDGPGGRRGEDGGQ